jgi:uncharacterized membrane-anchored protein
MKQVVWTTLCFLFLILAAVRADAQEQLRKQVEALPWQVAPAVGNIGTVARISLTKDLRFLDASSSSKFIELNGNPPRDNNYVLAPRGIDWFAVFSFDSTGYIRDDEKLEANELLRTLKEQNVKGTEERKRLNLPILRLTGWAVEPHYDLETRRLEWGTRLATEDGSETVNYSIRILGRSGVMIVILVSDVGSLSTDIQSLRGALRGFDFVPGERYAEFRPGDRAAEYGLAGLIIGGAAAVAAKSGALKGFLKVIGIAAVAGLAAVGAFLRNLFKKRQSK